MSLRRNPFENLMEMNLRPASQRILDVLPVEYEDFHEVI
jgi:hypothetical protein